VSLQSILDAIYVSGQAQVREIEAHAQAQVEAILAEAQIKARRIQEESCSAALAPAAAKRAHILHQARLEAMQIVGAAREALLDAALCQTKTCLANMRTDAAYAWVLRRLTKEALAELGGLLEDTRAARLEADPRDRELLENTLYDLRLELPISYDLHCWGGLVAKSEDGRVVVINTLESRLARATPYLCRCLAVLFEEETKDETCLAMTMAMPACGP
jgi:V/A-type H+-transporting ATPase subunit E